MNQTNNQFNQFMQNFQMFLQQNPGMMNMMNSGMMNNPSMMGMNPGMMAMNNPSMMAINNPSMMGMNPGMFGQQQNIPGLKNIYFKHKYLQISIMIQATDNESIASVINKYINKSGDNHINIYIFNGKKLNETLTVAEQGLINNCPIEVVPIDTLEGALNK